MANAVDPKDAIDGMDATAPTDVGGTGDADSTRERILDVAERLFARHGLAGTAVRDIAREAGLTAPSLYNHFDGKQALYEAVLARGVQPLFGLLENLGDREPDEATAAHVLDSIMDHFVAHPDIARLIQHESLTGGASLSQIAHGWLRPIVSQGLSAMQSNPHTAWSEEEQPLALAAWIHVILGHFASAPLLHELFDFDPLSEELIERQKRFLRRYAQMMMAGDPDRD